MNTRCKGVEIYNDEDSCVASKPLKASNSILPATKTFFNEKILNDKQGKRIALAEIASCSNNSNIENKIKINLPNAKKLNANSATLTYVKTDILAKPENKFFKYKRYQVEPVAVLEEDEHGEAGSCVSDMEPTTIWSPLRDDSILSDSTSPMLLDRSISSEFIHNDVKENYSVIESPDLYLASEFGTEIYSHLLNLEVKFRPKAHYMKRQPDITSNMRTIVVDWLVEVCVEYKLETETLYLAIAYVDRFLSAMSVVRSKLQLVGTAALFIASKYEEIYPPDLKEFVYITDDTYTKRQVLRMEHLLLEVLAFDLAVPTAFSFVQRLTSLYYAKTATIEPQRTANLAKYICELSLLDGDKFLCYLPSQIASAAFSLAKYTMGQESWSDLLEDISGYEEVSFRDCVLDLHNVFVNATHMKHKAIYEKYKSPKYNCVSLITPPPLLHRSGN